MKRYLCIGLLLAVVALVYANTLRNQFTMDDGVYILRNSQVTDASLSGLFAPHKISNVFRPVTFASFALNSRLGGGRPFDFHFFILILPPAPTFLIFFLLLLFFASSPP